MKHVDVHNQLAARMLKYVESKQTDQVEQQYRVPSTDYTDPKRFEQEVELIFKRLPIFAATTAELTGSGRYKALELMGVPVLLTRQRDGSIRAMLNVCSHRAMPVAKGSGKCERFACPYHAWLYGSDGQLLRVAGEDTFGQVDKASMGMTQLPVYEQSGMIFVILTPGIEFDFASFFAGMLEDIGALGFADWHFCGTRELKGANWKVAYDGYLEGYHFAAAHPDTIHQRTFSNIGAYHFYGSHQVIGFPQKTMEKLKELPSDQLYMHENDGYDFIRTLFPNVSIFVAPEITQIAQLIPGPTVEQNRTVLHFLARQKPATEQEQQANEEMMNWLQRVVQEEDYDLGLEIQKGLASGAYEYVTFGRNEPGNQIFHQWVNYFLGEPGAKRPL